MCGIVGYIGKEGATSVLIDGLSRLEYRGYDSAGVALQNGNGIHIIKRAGRIRALEEALKRAYLPGHAGIAHTRWATHGGPTDQNAHPHLDCTGRISVVHNGIIENYRELRSRLISAGHTFRSETDSEVIAHLIEEAYARLGLPEVAVREALADVKGSYAIAALFADAPDILIATRKESPLVIGLGAGENYVASDVPAIVHRTRDVVILDDGELAVVRHDQVALSGRDGRPIEERVVRVDWNPEAAEKGGYAHFMIKEIHEQPEAVSRALAGRIVTQADGACGGARGAAFVGASGGACEDVVDLSSIGWTDDAIRRFNQVHVVACGTAYHAGLVGKRMIEQATDLAVMAEIASEYRYAEPRTDDRTLVITISQSGETADTLAAMREAKSRGAHVLAVTNVVGSSVAREADWALYTQAGPEIAVASTKAYLTQLVCLALVSLHLGRARGEIESAKAGRLVSALKALPHQVKRVIEEIEPKARALATSWEGVRDAFYIGRSTDYAVAMEGQLKLKEIAYVHAEALAAGELKHGTLALIEPGVPVIALVTQNRLFEKSVSNLKEVAARGGRITALAMESCPDRASLEDAASDVWYLPATEEELAPVLAAAPLQLIAYYCALHRGCDVDKPRNLAKAVTVE